MFAITEFGKCWKINSYKLKKVYINENWSDMMTKVIPNKKFEIVAKVRVWCPLSQLGRGRFVGFHP